MSHHKKQLLSEICASLDRFAISYKSLDIEITEHINQYWTSFWRGSTSQIDWKLIPVDIQKVDFPYATPIDAQLTHDLLHQANFRVLKHTDSILYFSGMSPCLLLKSNQLKNIIFHLMDEFCYLETFLIFTAQPILEQQKIADFLEIQLFQYFCGQI